MPRCFSLNLKDMHVCLDESSGETEVEGGGTEMVKTLGKTKIQ